MIDVRLDGLLAERERSYYWLAKETGVSHTTLWRLKKGKALGINFETLEKICGALGCQPGDVLSLASTTGSRRPARTGAAGKSRRGGPGDGRARRGRSG